MVKVDPPDGWSPPAIRESTGEPAINPEPPAQKDVPTDREGEAGPVLPNANWASPSSRQRLYIGASMAAGLLLCFAVLAIGRAMMSDDNPTEAITSQVPRESTKSLDNSPEDETSPENVAADPPTDDGEPTVSDDPPGNGKAAGTKDAAETDATATDARSTPADQTPANTGPIEKVAEPVTPTGPPRMSAGPPGLVDKHEAEPAAAEEFTAPSLLAELEMFGDLLDDPTLGDEATEEAGIEDVLEPREVADEVVMLPRPEKRDVDVAARLNDPLLGIELNDVSLAEFIRFISDFSTISISFDPAALQQRQVSPRTAVSTRREETTIGEVLHDVLSSRGLEYIERDGQLLIVAASSEADSWREVTYDVSDLAGGSADQLKSMAEWISSLIEPKSWKGNGGPGTLQIVDNSLVVRHNEAVQFQVLMLCEKLRVARSLSPRSSYPVTLFRLDPRASLAREPLERTVSMNYLDAARLVDILDRAQQQAGMSILVDWHALAESGWNPDASFPYSVDSEPLRTMLDRLLARMELTYRIINEDTIQITTGKRLLNLSDLEFHHAGGLVSEELTWKQLVAHVKATVGEVYFLDHAGAMAFDPQSEYLIVALPQPQQVTVAGILASLRKGDSSEE